MDLNIIKIKNMLTYRQYGEKGKYMKYEEYLKQEQEAINSLPLFFAFSNEQFEETMNEHCLTVNDTDKIYRLPGMNGGFFLKSDLPIIKAYFGRKDILPDLMKDHDFAVSAFKYEMFNHEYAINYYQGDYDVCSCFCRCEFDADKDYRDYLAEANHKEWIAAYSEARSIYNEEAQYLY